MGALRITAKRQATLPKALCDEMGVSAGQVIHVEPAIVNGERVWIIKPPQKPLMPWFGCLRRYARKVKKHDMASIRASMAKHKKEGWD
ncbi:MAG TPA: hypothetical protein VEJ63_06075 [Planctomycetota bacterium]|nr:hypothetical protein [Planctomycetota bacterium]